MARRKTILAINEIYHVYNRGVEKRPIFLRSNDYLRFIELMNYYRFKNCPIKYSYFRRLSREEKENIFFSLQKSSAKLVDIFAFCLMPNHVHILLKQLLDNGVSKFMGKITNSFSHYFNTRQERIGHLFQGNFGASRIEDDEQLIHVSRYIHLNPVSSYIIEINKLHTYKYSSYPEYLGQQSGFCNTEEVLSHFKNKESYKMIIDDQADYARKLENIKHLILE